MIEERLESDLPEEDPVRKEEFKRIVWLQIYLPVILATIAVILLVILAIGFQYGTTSVWADALLMMLSLIVLTFGIIILGILVMSLYYIGRLNTAIKRPLLQGQEITDNLARQTRRLSDSTLRPFLAMSATKAAISQSLRSLASIFSREESGE
ncbi:MAG: hypothetical protein GTO18_21620 [Anaerolineales bacterium]|nr:hypothetical protein [Anaerolineales bacterium]